MSRVRHRSRESARAEGPRYYLTLTAAGTPASNAAATGLFQFSRGDEYTVWGGRVTKEIIGGLERAIRGRRYQWPVLLREIRERRGDLLRLLLVLRGVARDEPIEERELPARLGAAPQRLFVLRAECPVRVSGRLPRARRSAAPARRR